MKKKRKLEQDSDIVYIYEEHCLGKIISYGAYASTIKYSKDGIQYEIDILNDEFEILKDFATEHIIEEDL